MIAFGSFAIHLSRKFNDSGIYKLPIMFACTVFCYFQTQTILWYPKVPYLYSFAFIFISSLMLRTTVLKSVIFGTFLSAVIWPGLIESNQSSSMMLSAVLVTQFFIVFIKSKYMSDIRLFIANQKNIEAQRKFIEINLEFTNQVKAFLPLQISKRLMHAMKDERMNVIQAIDEVLRPKTSKIACLFSDIRGFTKGVNNLEGFVSESLLPNLKATTQAVEMFEGIPRKIGDLLFSYFDSTKFENNIRNCVRSAFEISNINKELNQNLPNELHIKRYILLASGEAMVGNLSGYESSIEITAIGRPVNLLSRIDEATKNPSFRSNLNEGDIIITSDMAQDVQSIFPGISLSLISLDGLSVKIRDFEDVKELYLAPLTKKNYSVVFGEIKKLDNGAAA